MRLSALYPLKNIRIFAVLLCLPSIQQSYAQEFDKTYFRSPLNIPLFLTGDFGELRTNHFHTGLDIKCNGASGYKIYATADGYLGRIKVGHYGYGRVLYINHPNGLTTVYAHQSKFSDELEKYVREQQYELQSEEIDVYPDSTLHLFKKGDVIGYTGNSGTSSGPHLHFEVRQTKNDNPINPWLFGFEIKDEIAPTIYNIKIYPLNDTSSVNGSLNPVVVKATGSAGKYTLATAINAYGMIGFAVHTTDLTSGSGNHCGPYSIELLNEKDTIFKTEFKELCFETNRYINAHMDYLAYRDNENSYHKSFIKGINQLPIYSNNAENGCIKVDGKEKIHLKFIVKDINGNASTLSFAVMMQKSSLKKAEKTCTQFIEWDKDTVFKNDEIEITFPDSSLYDDLCFDYLSKVGGAGYYANIHTLHDNDIPIMYPITLKIKTNYTDTNYTDKLVGVFIKENGGISSEGGTYENGYVTFTTRSFGKYSVMVDKTAPVISPSLVYDGKVMAAGKSFKFTLGDNLTGVKKYNAFIDDKWVLAHYDVFKNVLTIDLDAENIGTGAHELILKVGDGRNNESVYSCKFTR